QVLYFGADPAVHRVPAKILDKSHWRRFRTEDDVRQLVRGHYVSAGTTLLYGSYDKHGSSEMPDAARLRLMTDFLRAHKPVDRTTTSLIYDFRRDPQQESAGSRRAE